MSITTVAETGSTNADLLALAAAGGADGVWLRAERQSGGRGRLGRVWQSPPGNLHASTIIRLLGDDPPAPTLALVAGVALHDAAAAWAGAGAVSLKWPNDLMAGNAKLAGILLERAGDAVVAGFGMNVAHGPDGLDRAVISLAALCGDAPAPDAAAVAERLADVLTGWLARWRSEGLAPIRAAWLDRAHAPGTPLRAMIEGNAVDGTFAGLSTDGALLLRVGTGATVPIRAGDVFLL